MNQIEDYCLCEHAEHPVHPSQVNKPHPLFPEFTMDHHFYMGVAPGKREARWVGPICDECADTHMKPYLVN